MKVVGLSVAMGGRAILSEATVEFPEAGTLAVVGSSGSGKTTLLRACLGLLPPGARMSGQLLWRNSGESTETTDLARLDAEARRQWRRRCVGYIPQEPGAALDRRMRVEQLLAEAGAQDAASALCEVGLEGERAGDYPFQWSGGMQQRLLAAMAVARHPRLLLADEPTSALDPLAQAEWIVLMRELQSRLGFALVWVTHDLAAAAQLCEQVVVLDQGRVVETGGATHQQLCAAQPEWL